MRHVGLEFQEGERLPGGLQRDAFLFAAIHRPVGQVEEVVAGAEHDRADAGGVDPDVAEGLYLDGVYASPLEAFESLVATAVDAAINGDACGGGGLGLALRLCQRQRQRVGLAHALCVGVALAHGAARHGLALGLVARIGLPGDYATTVTRPAMFKDYLIEQLADLPVDVEVTDAPAAIAACLNEAATASLRVREHQLESREVFDLSVKF